jgi:hypothetical protein
LENALGRMARTGDVAKWPHFPPHIALLIEGRNVRNKNPDSLEIELIREAANSQEEL